MATLLPIWFCNYPVLVCTLTLYTRLLNVINKRGILYIQNVVVWYVCICIHIKCIYMYSMHDHNPYGYVPDSEAKPSAVAPPASRFKELSPLFYSSRRLESSGPHDRCIISKRNTHWPLEIVNVRILLYS